MSRMWRRIRAAMRRGRLEADLAEEIESHRAMLEQRLRQSGLSAQDAAAASRRALGNVTLAREDAREQWRGAWIDSVRQDVAYALRTLARNPGLGAAVVVVTALGIGAATTVFGLVNRLILEPLPVSRPGQLVYLTKPSFSYPVFQQVRGSSSDVFGAIFAWKLESTHVAWNGELEAQEVLMASGEMYPTLGIRAAAGRLLAAEDDRIGGGPSGLVAVISDACWQRRFARDPSAIGRVIRIDRQPFTIVGVTPPGFFGVAPGLSPDVTIPLTTLQDARGLASTSSDWVHMMGRLRDGVTIEQANAALQRFWPHVLASTLGPRMPPDRRALYLGRTTSIASAVSGYSRVRNAFAEPLWLLFGLAGLLFTVACASTANLLLARGVARYKEISIRLSIGASRGRVIRQVLTETFVWTAIGAAGGALLSSWAGGLLVTMFTTPDEPIAVDLAPDWRLALFVLGLTVIAVALCAAWPAYRATSRPATEPRPASTPLVLTGSMLRRWSLGKVIVAAQVALTMVLVIGAALFVRSLLRIVSQDAGVDRQQVLVVTADAEAAGYADGRLTQFNTELRERLAALPGIQSVSSSLLPPLSDENGSWTQGLAIEGDSSGDAPRPVYFNAVSPEYFRTTGISVLGGRDFTGGDTSASGPVVAVNRSLAQRFFPNHDPIGQRITIGRGDRRRVLEIVAIVADSKYERMQETPRPIAYVPVAQQGQHSNLFVEVRTAASGESMATAVRQEVRALDPAVPVRIETVADRIATSLVKERALALLASALGITALLLACAALFGLLAYAVSRQTKEIGLRIALGAARPAVIWMVLRDSLIVAVSGVVVGLIVALALGRLARTMLYQISTSDSVSLAGSALLMTAVATTAALAPSLRASRVDPANALKAE
jgi:putative ABC transport system permease protein